MSIADRILNRLGLQVKAAPPAPLYNQHGPYDYRYSPTWGRRYDTGINYKSEVGNLDTSSLVMAVVHWKATQLPEAQPVVQYPGENNAYEIQWGHEVSSLIRRPNPFTTWAEDCFLLALALSIDGNFYWYKRRDSSFKLYELWALPWFMVKERWPGDGGSPAVPTTGPNAAENDYLSHYQYNQPGRTPLLSKHADIVH
jgi:hypothetical protein